MRKHEPYMKRRWGMAIDLDKCTGCGQCAVSCAQENNLPVSRDESDPARRVAFLELLRITNDRDAVYPNVRTAFIPKMCQHCEENAPCAAACPVNAIDTGDDGIVGLAHDRCTGCRYCMAACPYSAISFNWERPKHDGTFKNSLNPEVSIPARGTAVKCLFCVHIWKRERQKAAAAGIIDINSVTYTPACAAACPTGAIVFGDLNEPQSEAARLAADKRAFRLPGRVSASPKVWYLSGAQWIKDMMIFKKREGHE